MQKKLKKRQKKPKFHHLLKKKRRQAELRERIRKMVLLRKKLHQLQRL